MRHKVDPYAWRILEKCATHKDPLGGAFRKNAPPLSLDLCNYPLPCLHSNHSPLGLAATPRSRTGAPRRRSRPEPPLDVGARRSHPSTPKHSPLPLDATAEE